MRSQPFELGMDINEYIRYCEEKAGKTIRKEFTGSINKKD